MKPPEAPRSDAGTMPPAVFARPGVIKPQVMRKRADFLAAARAGRRGTSGMMIQARRRDDGSDTVRVGFTCSKKVGNAVARNRAKRRLRAVAREVLPAMALPGWDYVLIGRAGATAARPYDLLRGDLEYALRKLHADGAAR